MLTHLELKNQYEQKRAQVKSRLNEFKLKGERCNRNDLFLELCFCICTPQSKAIKVAEVINKANIKKLMNSEEHELALLLRKNTRFHNNKAKSIVHARQFISQLPKLSKDSQKAREFIVNNIRGLGYKEASHFLRNIGHRDICIIDRHVINLMNELGVFSDTNVPSTAKKYLQMEKTIKDYAHAHNYDVDELDLVLWSIRTGFVFR